MKNWCAYTHNLIKELGLDENWDSDSVESLEEWNAKVTAAIKAREKLKWKEELQSMIKLRTYKRLEKELEAEEYIIMNRMSKGRRLLTSAQPPTSYGSKRVGTTHRASQWRKGRAVLRRWSGRRADGYV